jgi:hypothetical protein
VCQDRCGEGARAHSACARRHQAVFRSQGPAVSSESHDLPRVLTIGLSNQLAVNVEVSPMSVPVTPAKPAGRASAPMLQQTPDLKFFEGGANDWKVDLLVPQSTISGTAPIWICV